ncbi:hypothetical protein [Pseudomonas sp. B15(2017)]|uniref:hypothetical protein n=1 Tax=Pseudomonas sp. B15(2017) TaxID=1981744 RepID=UPI00111C15BC|nr:hypothetical protein [Pseudomonas sp. B15(2017)]
MKWMFGIGALFACVVCGLLGLIAGINLNPTSTVKFVPDMGSLADWISGIGSVSAAGVALYLADRQRRENTAKIEISQYYTRDNFTIDLVSTGEKPAVVKGIFIRSPQFKRQILLNRSPIFGYDKIIGRYEYGETKRLSIDASFFLSVALEIEHELGSKNFDGLLLVVGTATAEFRAELNADFLHELRKEAAEE